MSTNPKRKRWGDVAPGWAFWSHGVLHVLLSVLPDTYDASRARLTYLSATKRLWSESRNPDFLIDWGSAIEVVDTREVERR